MVTTLMMSEKMITLGLLKIKLFGNKDYDFKIFVHDVIKKNLLWGSSYIVDSVMRPEFFNSSISMGDVIKISVS